MSVGGPVEESEFETESQKVIPTPLLLFLVLTYSLIF